MDTETLRLLTDPFRTLAQRFVAQVPSFAAAFLFLFAGFFFARMLKIIIEKLLSRTNLDNYTEKIGINEVLARLGMGRSPSRVLSFILYWFVLLVFFVSAANVVNLLVVSELLERLMLFLPSLAAAIVIVFAGLLLARLISEMIINAAEANRIHGGAGLAQCAWVVVIAFTGIMALEQLGIRIQLVTSSFQIIVASLGLAFGLAFGLGGKDIAEEILRHFLNKKKQ